LLTSIIGGAGRKHEDLGEFEIQNSRFKIQNVQDAEFEIREYDAKFKIQDMKDFEFEIPEQHAKFKIPNSRHGRCKNQDSRAACPPDGA
jgi:hypothetical protein